MDRGPDEELRAEASQQPQRLRWRAPLIILALGAALVAAIQGTDLFANDAAVQFLSTSSAIALTLLLLAFWAIFFTGLPARTRTVLVVLGVGLVVGFFSLVRIEGVSGDMRPAFAWRWRPPLDQRLAKGLSEEGKQADATIDLTHTTADDFPQFLGPDRNGKLSGPALARDWQAEPPEQMWRQPIGAGWSSFAVIGPYAITQEQRGDQELVTCYELLTGKLLWAHADPGRFSEVIAGDGPRSTPTIVDGRVYALGASGRLNCLDGATGEAIWSHDVLEENKAPNVQWGKSCSPAVIGNLVVVSAGGPDGHSLVAYDKSYGDERWHAGDDPSSYSSPVLAKLAGAPQILIINHHALAAHDPVDGHVLWRYQWQGSQPKVAQPIPVGDSQVLIASGYGVGSMLLDVEQDGDGKFSVQEAWKSHNLKLKPKFTNPVLRDGFVYGLDDGRSLVCLEAESGKRRWQGGHYGHGQLLLVGDLLLVQAESGEMALVEASPKRYRELTTFQAIDGKSWNNPVLAGQYLLVRNAEEAACYKLPLTEQAAADAATTSPYEEASQEEEPAAAP
jgi:outer membrane protein assembly factor BamB